MIIITYLLEMLRGLSEEMDLKCLNSAASGSIPQPSAMIVKVTVAAWTPWKNWMH